MQVDGATSTSTISLVDVDVGSFSSYIYQPTPWAKHTKTTVRGASSLGNPSCSKLYFSHLLSPSPVAVAVAVAAALLSPAMPHRCLDMLIIFSRSAGKTHRRCLSLSENSPALSVALTIFISHLLGCFSLFLSQQDNKSSCSCPDAVRLLDQAPYKLACMP